MKREYLEKIRSSSAYPTLRGFATFFSVVGYLLAVLVIVAGFGSKGVEGGLVGIAVSMVIVLLTRLAKESALLLADVADAVLDIGSRGLLNTGALPTASVGIGPRTHRPAEAPTGGNQLVTSPSGETRMQQPTEVQAGTGNLKCAGCGYSNPNFQVKCVMCQKALLAAT